MKPHLEKHAEEMRQKNHPLRMVAPQRSAPGEISLADRVAERMKQNEKKLNLIIDNLDKKFPEAKIFTEAKGGCRFLRGRNLFGKEPINLGAVHVVPLHEAAAAYLGRLRLSRAKLKRRATRAEQP